MRLKTYTAKTMREAMSLIRAELGEDAVIVSNDRVGKGVRVTAAIEAGSKPESAGMDPLPRLRQTLAAHGFAEAITLRLLEGAEDAVAEGAGSDVEAIAQSFARVLRFQKLTEGKGERPILLLGPPGMGKTSLVGKLAARAWTGGKAVRVITTDMARAGGIEQLRAYADALKIGLRTAADTIELKAALSDAGSADLALIDTTGVNPFDREEMAALEELIEASGAEPVLVLAAGVDGEHNGEILGAFRALGCRRLCVTRLDIARRLGGLLTLADARGLALAAFSETPRIAQGLIDAEPEALAARLLEAPARAPAPSKPIKVPA